MKPVRSFRTALAGCLLALVCAPACSTLFEDPDDYPMRATINGSRWESSKTTHATLSVGMSQDQTEIIEQLTVEGKSTHAGIKLNLRWGALDLPLTFELVRPDSDEFQTAEYTLGNSRYTCTAGQVTMNKCGSDGNTATGTFWLNAAILSDTVRITDGKFTGKVVDLR